ncbi:MAG: exodeoxyribonuclease VII large subunit [Gammaproteobacteria bacterium]|tara:strand:+ start:1049 stop:2416 length:1368 start_codon:yes stop_codon:yes gene_type:complete
MNEFIVDHSKEIISVGELNRSAKFLLEDAFNNISVIGEISNMSRPSSGHIYFTLKDEDGAIGCAMWRSQAIKLNFVPENGNKCILKGQVSIYPATGRYQLMVKTIEQAGDGNLMQQFENLKKKLDSEGLFDSQNKLSIPFSPKHIGVITSSSTAAFQDILSTFQRRAPSAQVSISPAVVQGDNAPRTLIKAMNRIIHFNESNADNKIDVVILARGGGTIEDLWCFNNEELAREISTFPIPTISGVGHEIDFTISDFVADMRAPTPTAAAELVTEFNFKIRDRIDELSSVLKKTLLSSFKSKKLVIESLKLSIKSPLSILREQNQKLDAYELIMKQKIEMKYSKNIQSFKLLLSRLMDKSPKSLFQELNNKINYYENNLTKSIKNNLSLKSFKLKEFNKNLIILSPLSILDRGYSIIQNKKGDAIKSYKQTCDGEKLSARLGEGYLEIEVKKSNEK